MNSGICFGTYVVGVKGTSRQFDIELCTITLCCNGEFFRAENKEHTMSHRKLTFMNCMVCCLHQSQRNTEQAFELTKEYLGSSCEVI